VPTAQQKKPETSARNPARTRARILRAATVVFAAKGPDAARVDEIAALARVNKRMLYHHFGTKEALYRSVLKETFDRLGQIGAEVLNTAGGMCELLDGILREYFGFLQQNPEFIALLNWENSTRAAGLRSIALCNPAKEYMAAMRRALDREQKNFNIHEDVDIKYLMMACLALCTYYFTDRHTLSVVFDVNLDDPVCMEQWVTHVRRLILDGILNKAISGSNKAETDTLP
jgi:AcrR family transcriptional regulator